MENYTITLGYVPVRRDMFPDKPAAMMNQKIQVRIKEICEKLGDIELIDIGEVVEGGLLWCKDDVNVVIEYLKAKKVDGCYADVLKESCKYIGHLNHDSVNEINSL